MLRYIQVSVVLLSLPVRFGIKSNFPIPVNIDALENFPSELLTFFDEVPTTFSQTDLARVNWKTKLFSFNISRIDALCRV